MIEREQWLEMQGDMLLARAGAAKDPEFPAYTESYLAQRSRRRGERRFEDLPEEEDDPRIFDWLSQEIRLVGLKDFVDYLLQMQISEQEHLMVMLWYEGYTLQEIARRTGSHFTLQGIHQIIRRTGRQVVSLARSDRYKDWLLTMMENVCGHHLW